MNVIKDYLKVIGTVPGKRKRPAFKMDWTTLTVHNTGNPDSTAFNERAWLDNPQNTSATSWHYVIAQDTIVQAIPDNENAWHAGDGIKGKGNLTSIGIELCESGDFEHTMRTAAKFIAEKLKEKDRGIASVVTHKHWSGKNCPRLLLPRWGEFLGMIQKELDLLNKPTPINVPYPWSVDAINWARFNKISDCTRLEDPITRREVIVLLYNTVNYIIKQLTTK